MKTEPIVATTCEDRGIAHRGLTLAPSNGESSRLFRVEDPFGLRKAVVPLFWMEKDGHLAGLGTAFALDPWGHFMTAEHVTSIWRDRGRMQKGTSNWHVRMPPGEGLITILGFGLAFGIAGVPRKALAPIINSWSPCVTGDDPLAALDGRMDQQPLDLAVLTAKRPAADLVKNLPLVSRPCGVRLGDIVAAIGYPELATFRGDSDEAVTTVEEGMFVSYGRVTALYPDGRDRSTPTPVFEVEANWPPGMSGGPVLNVRGEIVGLVSRSMLPENSGHAGMGWATWFEPLGGLAAWVPTLDKVNCDGRRGWGVFRPSPWNLAGVFPEESEAIELLKRHGPEYVARKGTWSLGTNDFMY